MLQIIQNYLSSKGIFVKISGTHQFNVVSVPIRKCFVELGHVSVHDYLRLPRTTAFLTEIHSKTFKYDSR